LEVKNFSGAVGGVTVTVKLQLAPPHEPMAKQLTVVVPTGKVLPEGGLQAGVGVHPPLTIGEG
jgi:hypothetical protein